VWPDCSSSSGMEGSRAGLGGLTAKGWCDDRLELGAWVEQDSQCGLSEITLPMLWP
jgi:hypothetical protein